MRYKVICIMVITLVSIQLIGCNGEEVGELKNEIIDKNQQIRQLEEQVQYLENENEDLKTLLNNQEEEISKQKYLKHYSDEGHEFLMRILDNASESHRVELLKKAWTYSLYYQDGEMDSNDFMSMSDNKTIIIESEELTISISEKFLMLEILGKYMDDIHDVRLGEKTRSYVEYINITSEYTYEMGGRDGTVATGRNFLFTNIESGFEAKLEISEELAEWLGMEPKTIIFIKE